MSDSIDILKQQLISRFGLDSQNFTESTALFSSGLLDSVDFLDVVSEFEKATDCHVKAIDFKLDYFDTIKAMREFNSQKQ